MRNHKLRTLALIILCISLIVSLTETSVLAVTTSDNVEGLDYSLFTTEELIQSIIDHNYGIHLFLNNDTNRVYNYFLSNFGEFSELETRSNAYEVLTLYYCEHCNNEDSLVESAIIGLLLNKVATNYDSDDNASTQAQARVEISYRNPPFHFDHSVLSIPTITYSWTDNTYTLNNSMVPLYTANYTLTDANKSTLDARINRALDNITKVSDASSAYNCHSYAWYNRTLTNDRFMAFVEYYIYDPHYLEVSKNNAQVGDVVVYQDADEYYTHSAIIINKTMSGGIVPFITCESKFGICGVYQHDIDNVIGSYYAGFTSPQYKIYRYTTSHEYEHSQYDSISHKSVCPNCDEPKYLPHNTYVTTKTALNHTLKCSDCGWTRTEAHSYPSGSQKCKTCGYNNNGHNTASVEITPIP